ncbi:MAG: phenylalanine--tRNA ligase subunit beta [Candidatus Ryanbacteria bacterium RIFCSPLOWO2_02_FULL_44_40]|nr:MAG: phenylalanine--tRNA ligase subunit beta [Candidatus Ryanbacteria bacterium RIFCSPLOWO2_02_FULL_44_40]OGZ55300.1 MAG: phenylalanine--tRNA ligase subunit beta [Candidatus Ryanbacteria bacterium RIFCSPLOWO2_12_FULL_44_26]
MKGIPPADKLAELITFHSFEVESINKVGKDTVLHIDVLPNRMPDCNGHIGLAREIAAVIKKTAYLKKPHVLEGKKRTADVLRVTVEHVRDCPRYAARYMSNVTVKKSPLWMRERLVSCGIKPINNIVDAANYIMLETGQPLHIFDADKVKGAHIIVRRAKEGEKMVSLDGESYVLDNKTLVIADEEGVIAIAGVKGGKRTGVTGNTRRIILESANFSRTSIRRTSRAIGLITDASVRFSSGLDTDLVSFGIDRLAVLIRRVAGGEISSGIIDMAKKPAKSSKIMFSINDVNNLLGTAIKQKTATDILKRLEFEILKKRNNGEIVVVSPPPFRLDILNKEDVIEEIGRIWGYDNIQTAPPHGMLAGAGRDDDLFFTEELRDTFSHLGFIEQINYVFESGRLVRDLKINTNTLVVLQNPISEDAQFLRNGLLVPLLENVARNIEHTKDVLLFEIGHVFRMLQGKIDETTHCTAVMSGGAGIEGEKGNLFLEAKGFVSAIFERFGIADYWFGDLHPTDSIEWPLTPFEFYHPFRNAYVYVGRETVGTIFEVHPEVLRKLRIHGRVVAFEFCMGNILKVVEAEKEYRPISKYPSIVRDIAVLVSSKTRVYEVVNIIESAGGSLLIDSDLFDYYEGEQIEEGRKSLAFHLMFQSPNRTLTDGEVDNIMKRIIKNLEKNNEWEVR